MFSPFIVPTRISTTEQHEGETETGEGEAISTQNAGATGT